MKWMMSTTGQARTRICENCVRMAHNSSLRVFLLCSSFCFSILQEDYASLHGDRNTRWIATGIEHKLIIRLASMLEEG